MDKNMPASQAYIWISDTIQNLGWTENLCKPGFSRVGPLLSGPSSSLSHCAATSPQAHAEERRNGPIFRFTFCYIVLIIMCVKTTKITRPTRAQRFSIQRPTKICLRGLCFREVIWTFYNKKTQFRNKSSLTNKISASIGFLLATTHYFPR